MRTARRLSRPAVFAAALSVVLVVALWRWRRGHANDGANGHADFGTTHCHANSGTTHRRADAISNHNALASDQSGRPAGHGSDPIGRCRRVPNASIQCWPEWV